MAHHCFKRLPSFVLLRLSMSKWMSSKLIRPYLVRLAGVKIGKRVHIGANVTFDTIEPRLIQIGNDVTITMNCVLLMHYLKTHENGVIEWHRGKLTIGNNVFIGANTVITKPIMIGDNVIIAAGSVVTKDIPSNCLVGGYPRKSLDFLKLKRASKTFV